ncbi:coiled-coil domain-containing protein 24 [Fundulus heteroclitus]|uniref:coiled-coil domain-containing protein 24 n=1 Tax=Fundulus heteroclitus TaxID=8078 RepID=UPI00165A73B6|nr:coiled-coil domain-containing protein 24 [Fundulus heteroclitus]
MHSPDENQLWCPGQSLWSLIAEHVSQTELLNIRQALGHSLVDMYTEVHSEAEMLHNMWQDSRCYGNHRSGSGTCRLQGSPLSDPPAVKELVRAEVKMLLETLKERACNGGRYLDGEELLLRCQPETLNYVLGHQEISYRRSSNLKTAENFNSRPSSCCSVTSRAESEIDAVKDKLTVTEIHRVIARLRCVILEECEALAKTTKRLKESINQKFVSQPDSHKPEPSLAELKELRADIQTHLELLPSSAGASSFALGRRPRKSVRPPAESSSDTRVAPTPKSGFKPDLPPLWHRQPRPPRHDPPARTSSVRTLGLHRFTKASNESVKPSSSSRTDSDLKVTESQEPSSCSAEPASPENHPSTQCCVHRPSPDFDWSPHQEREKSVHSVVQEISI